MLFRSDDCGEYVMLKYEQLHLDSNHTFLKLDDEPGPTATWIKNDIDSGSLRSIKANNNKKPQLSTGKFENVDDADDDLYKMLGNLMKTKRPIGTTSNYPGVAYPVSGGSQRTVNRSPPPYQETSNESPDLVALPCEFCEAMIPVNQLLLHQTGCRPDLTSEARIKYPIKEFQKRNMKSSLHDEENIPLDIEDKNNSLETNPGTKLFEDKNERRNRDKVLLYNSGSMRRNAIDRGNEVSLRNDTDDNGIILPCEFCGDGYPPSLLLEHQDVCDYCPRNVPDMSPLWTESQDTTVEKLDGHMKANPGRTWKFEDSSHNTYVDSEQTYTNSARGKSNISNSYNDLHGNFSVASEWSDDGGSRPTSATGAIPKQKAGKLNFTRKVNQEVQSSRPSNSVSASHTRVSPDAGVMSSGSDFSPRFQIRNNLKDCDDDDES